MSQQIRDLITLRQSTQPQDLDLLGRMMLRELFGSLTGPSMAGRIIEQAGRGEERTLQNELNAGDSSQLMRPMISSVMQLDR